MGTALELRMFFIAGLSLVHNWTDEIRNSSVIKHDWYDPLALPQYTGR